MDIKRIGKFISAMRKEKGYKQKDLAEILNVSDKTISRWETGSGMPEVSMLIPLSRALDISLNELLSGEKEACVSDEILNDTIEYSMMQLNEQQRGFRKKMLRFVSLCMSVVLLMICCRMGLYLYEQRRFTSDQLGIDEYISHYDKNENGIADNLDMIEGVRKYIETHPVYQSQYYAGGYPYDGYGVSSDMLWNAMKYAGYDFKEMLNEDIQNNSEAYPHIINTDSNIDFRRLMNIQIFLERHAEKLTIFLEDPGDFQPGDILISQEHLMICSNFRNAQGFPFVFCFEPDKIGELNVIYDVAILGHYRMK